MAMLAEPRRKQRIGPNPRGKFFMEDATNKGRALLQKLGWQAGDGLGKTNQGMSAPLCPKIQMDSKGLGYDPKNDPWVVHNEEFAQILENLTPIVPSDTVVKSDVEDDGGEEKAEDESTQGKLESKSKKSRFRIHYHKFVKSKDVSNFSKTDLKCIFGKPTDALLATTSSAGSDGEAKAKPEENKKDTESNQGDFKTINSGSMADYFKSKMQRLKNSTKAAEELKTEDEKLNQINRGSMLDYFKSKLDERRLKTAHSCDALPILAAEGAENSTVTDDAPDGPDAPRKAKKSKRKATEIESPDSEVTPNPEADVVPRKKSKKHKTEHSEASPSEVSETPESVAVLMDEQKDRNRIKREKRKKAKHSHDTEELIAAEEAEDSAVVQEDISEEPPKKKKKKSKAKGEGAEPVEEGVQKSVDSASVITETVETKKGKKSKKHAEVVHNDAPLIAEAPIKKSKKSKVEPTVEEEIVEEPPKKSKKKKKEHLKTEDADIETKLIEEEQSPDETPKKKKKDKKYLNTDEITDISKSFPGANLHKIGGYAFY